MKILLRTNNPTVVSYIEHLLAEAGIRAVIMDEGMSIVEGSIGILPRRIMVGDDDMENAIKTLKEADMGHELDT